MPASSMRTPLRAACTMAFASAWTVRTQCPSSIRCPSSSQCGRPRIEPLYPVARMILSRTTTAPTNLRSQVERVATSRAMFMKYSSHETRFRMVTSCILDGVMPRAKSRLVAVGAAALLLSAARGASARGTSKPRPEQTAPPPADLETAERQYAELDYEEANHTAER